MNSNKLNNIMTLIMNLT